MMLTPLQYAAFCQWRDRYEKEDGRWVTLKSSEDAAGGAKVQIDGEGNILAGPDALGEKGIHNLKDFGDEESQDRNRQKLAEGHRKIKREARQGKDRLSNQDRLQDAVDSVLDEFPHLDEKALQSEIDDVWKETSKRLEERETAKAYARKLSGMTAGHVAAAENRGIDHGDMGKFDTVARDLVEAYPDLQGEFGGHDGPAKVWEFIREGKKAIPPKHDESIVKQAAERLNAAALDFGPMADESMPFAKRGDVAKYAGFYAWQKRYAKEKEESGERWITLNGGSGDEGSGGTPVKVDGSGNIVAGPKGLKDKGIEHVDHFGDKDKQKENSAKSKAADEGKSKKGSKAISSRFGIPVEAVEDILKTPFNELRKRDKSYESNTSEPTDWDRLPLGSVQATEWQSNESENYISVLTEIDPADLATSEHEDGIKKTQIYKDYVKWAKEGKEPPPLSVFQDENGKLVSSNRRRTLAAQEAGTKKLKVWLSPHNHETGLPLKLGDVKKAMKSQEGAEAKPSTEEKQTPQPPAPKPANTQSGLFGQVAQPTKGVGDKSQNTGTGKQGALFGKKGLSGQNNLFEDTGTGGKKVDSVQVGGEKSKEKDKLSHIGTVHKYAFQYYTSTHYKEHH